MCGWPMWKRSGTPFTRNGRHLGVLGRIYLSQEGINAQVSLPTREPQTHSANLDSRGSLPGSPLEDRGGR
jgi:predicted sulfurtransferase